MKGRVLLAVTGACAWAGAVVGQAPVDTARLDPVVVTATRVPAARSTVPAAVTVLTAEDLRREGVRTVAEALRAVPGAAVARTGSDGAATSLYLRGGESDYVRVLVDGVPLNEPGGAVDLADLGTAGLARIEVVRGPASVLYGSDAVSGVIHLITEGGGRRLGGGVEVAAGTYGTLDLRGQWQAAVGPVSIAVGGSRDRTDGIYAFNSDYANTVLHGRALLRPDDRTRLLVAVRGQQSDFHYPTDGTGSLVDSNAVQHRERRTGSVEVRRVLHQALEARLRATAYDGDVGIDDPPDHLADLERLQVQGDLSRRAVDGSLVVRPVAGTALTVGTQLERQTQRSASSWDGVVGPGTDAFEGARTTRAYYAEAQVSRERAGLTAGARIDDNSQFGTFVSYRAGAWVEVAGGVRVRVAGGRAFKEPLFAEQLAANPYEVGDPGLRPERAASWELGGDATGSSGRWRVSGTAFVQRFRDLIQYAFTFGAPPGTPTYFNVAAADARGLEVETEGVLAPWLVVDAAYTLLATDVLDAGLDTDGATFVEGEPLLRRPAHTLSGGARVSVHRARGTARVRYVGTRRDRDFSTYPATPVRLPGHAVVRLGAEVDVVGGGDARPVLGVGLHVDNVLGARYEEVFGFPAAGRRVMVETRVVF